MNIKDFLTGKTTDQLVAFNQGPFFIHKEANESLSALFKRAKNDGLDLALTSSYRSYDAQKVIWNNKVSGLRAVLDSDSKPVDISSKTPEELLFLILRWSAIPGGSRHHWGTDVDLYDQKVIPVDYKVQLIPSEYEGNGLFSKSHQWLTENMEDFGFFRPYSKDFGGIAPEPWHISYKPLSEFFLNELSYSIFSEHLEQSDFLLKEEALIFSSDIYQRFVIIP